jgi:predicted RNA binding protein YcfA (HicA-like mRNA interferase family)
MNRRRLLKFLIEGNLNNISFSDFINLVADFGFTRLRTKGSHHIYCHPHISELVNIQNVKGEVKPYQARQFLRLVERYNIKMEPEQ